VLIENKIYDTKNTLKAPTGSHVRPVSIVQVLTSLSEHTARSTTWVWQPHLTFLTAMRW